jgi:two-component system response regulator HydG
MSIKVLIVDDDSGFVVNLMNTAINNKISISTADSLTRAKTLLKKDKYDLVLANVKIPGGCSLSLKDEIKDNTPKTDFLFMSNLDADYDYINSMGEKCCHKYEINKNLGNILK